MIERGGTEDSIAALTADFVWLADRTTKQRSSAQINQYARSDLAAASIAIAQYRRLSGAVPVCAGSDQDVCGVDM